MSAFAQRESPLLQRLRRREYRRALAPLHALGGRILSPQVIVTGTLWFSPGTWNSYSKRIIVRKPHALPSCCEGRDRSARKQSPVRCMGIGVPAQPRHGKTSSRPSSQYKGVPFAHGLTVARPKPRAMCWLGHEVTLVRKAAACNRGLSDSHSPRNAPTVTLQSPSPSDFPTARLLFRNVWRWVSMSGEGLLVWGVWMSAHDLLWCAVEFLFFVALGGVGLWTPGPCVIQQCLVLA